MADLNSGARSNSTRVVYVGCKLPHGLTLELFHDDVATREAAQKAAETGNFSTRLVPLPKAKVTLKGANAVRTDYSVRGLSQPQFPFAVTEVSLDFWEQWLERHRDHPAITNGFIFIVDRERDAKAAAREREPEKTGLEPMRPDCENEKRLNTGEAFEEQVRADPDRLAALKRANGL